jgi:hypothetical protein
MKRLLLTIALVLVASPVFAQEVDLLPGGIGDLLDIAAPRGAAPARGAAPPRGGAPNAPPVDRLVRLRELMVQSQARRRAARHRQVPPPIRWPPWRRA